MTTIITRTGKGSPLTWAEADANLTNLNTDKLEATALIPYETIANAAATYATITTVDGKEPTITSGTTSQYWRGDKTWQTIDKTSVGLSNVDNTSDANKPVSTAQQTALDLKAPLASPSFTGTVTVGAVARNSPLADNDLSFDLSAKNNFACTPTAGGTLTFTNLAAGQSGSILLVNNANYAIAKAATVKTDASFLATISTTGTYRLSYYCDGTNVYVTTSGALS